VNRAIACTGAIVSLGFLAVSAGANYLFGYSLGRTETQSQLYAAVGVLAVAMNAFAPFYISWSLDANKPWKAASIALLWALCLIYSTTSALGFAAQNREGVAAARQVSRDGYNDTRRELLDLEARRKDAKGKERPRLDKRVDETRRKLESMRAKEADPPDAQSDFLSRLTLGYVPPAKIRIALVALFALMVEVGATLGLFAALSHESPASLPKQAQLPARWKPKSA